MVTKAIRSAQTQVEQQNFEIRKNVLKYDEVLNKQRTVIYDERRRVLDGEDIKEQIEHMLGDVVTRLRRRRHRRGLRRGLGPRQAVDGAGHALPGRPGPREARRRATSTTSPATGSPRPCSRTRARPTPGREAEIDAVIGAQGGMRELERQVLLQVMDRKWREHLYEMDYLKEGIGLRAMAQRDPLIEYQREGFDMFAAMLEGIKEETVGHLFNVRVQAAPPPAPAAAAAAAGPRPRRPSARPGRVRRTPTRRPAPAQPRRAERTARVPARSGNGAGGRHAAPEGDPAATTGALPTVLERRGPAAGGGAAVQRAGRGRGHRPQPLRAARHRGRTAAEHARRAGAEPAVPVRLGPQVQALPRDADGRPTARSRRPLTAAAG